MQVLLNDCYGGFNFSEEFKAHIRSKYPNRYEEDSFYFVDRADPVFIEEALSFGLEKASGHFSNLVVVEIPDNVNYSIYEYDGMEQIEQTWITVTLDELKSGLSKEKLDMVVRVDCIKLEE